MTLTKGSDGSSQETISYTYDKDQNIKSITETDSSGTSMYSYDYNSLNELVRENISTPSTSVSYQYGYDGNGNMTSKKVYAYTPDGQSLPATATDTYTYSYDAYWKDQLINVTETSSSGQQVSSQSYSYDGAGNMTSDGTNTYTYQGKELKTATTSSGTYTYDYNDKGIRTDKVVGGGQNKLCFKREPNSVPVKRHKHTLFHI